MLDNRTAAHLLIQAASLRALTPVADALGFGPPVALDAELGEEVGLARADGRAAVAPGAGLLRALLVEGSGTRPARQLTERLAHELSMRAPQLLWVLVLTLPESHEVVLATWDVSRGPPRIRALTVDRRRVVDSDAATLRALCASAPSATDTDARAPDTVAHAAWMDVLGRDALTRRFYRELVQVVDILATSLRGTARIAAADRADFALLQLSRLIFLSFVEARGWLDGDPAFLAHSFERCMRSGGNYHRRVLRPLIFGTLNTPPHRRAQGARALGRIPFLNGGLFARTPLERRLGDARWDDDVVGVIFERLLGRYRFTAREDQQRWTDAAIDPELLGRAFESLMGSGVRRDTGAFYTPPALVERVTGRALASALKARLSADSCGGMPGDAALVEAVLAGACAPEREASRVLRAVRSIRLLDPACGSGAFLVHTLETLADLAMRSGDQRPVATIRRELAASSIFGVDVNPMAVWLCELRLWLSVLIECDTADPLRVPPLPNLDHHVRVGDSLDGGGMHGPGRLDRATATRLARLRTRYTRASGTAKRTVARALEHEERRAAIAGLDGELAVVAARRRDLLAAGRMRDLFGERTRPPDSHARTLERLRAESRRLRARRRALLAGRGLPFAFATHFADVAAAGGFNLVLGNPPWVRPHRLPPADRRRLREAFTVASTAAWRTGAELAGAGSGFGGQADLAALFVERGLTLLAPGGTMAFLLPAKLWRSLSGGGVRALLTRDTRLVALEDWSGSPHAFDAAVYPSLLVAALPTSPEQPGHREGGVLGNRTADAAHIRASHGAHCRTPPAPAQRRTHAAQGIVSLAEWRGAHEERWREDARRLPLDGEDDAPWVLLPPPVRRAFDLLREHGTPLAMGAAGRPLLGVKTGCNDAYLFRIGADGRPDAVAELGAELQQFAAGVEMELLRPLTRGEDMRPWRPLPSGLHILWPHAPDGRTIAEPPSGAMRWLLAWRDRLERRADARGSRRDRRWWGLFRTEAAASDMHRVTWADMGREPRAGFIPAGSPLVPLNSCYVLRTGDEEEALALTALLNAPIVAAWLAALAEPARGGYRRHLAWTLAFLPMPGRWVRARGRLASLATAALGGTPTDGGAVDDVVRWAYGVRADAMEPLLEWAAR